MYVCTIDDENCVYMQMQGQLKSWNPPSSGQSHMNSDAESSMKENSELAQLALLLLY